MGSFTKKTNITDSDIDLLCIIPNERKMGIAESINHIVNIIKSYNPTPDNHSAIVKKDKVRVDIIPGYKTNQEDIYRISDKKENKWITRGQDKFIDDFLLLDDNLNEKLSMSVKLLKMWNEHHNNFKLPSLAFEVIAYDVLKDKNPRNFTESFITVMESFKERIKNNIKHPSLGPQLNPLNENDRVIWDQVLEKNLKNLKSHNIINWRTVLGNSFTENLIS